MEESRDYEPIQPRGGGPNIRKALERGAGLAILIGGTALKWGFIFVKFFSIFISVAAYELWFGSWTFAIGFVLMLLVHELGHVAAARRQGIGVTWPMFIPFVGAYVKVEHAGLTPWRNTLVSLAGPFTGGLAAAAVWGVGSARDSTLLIVLANIGFLLNAFNMLPIGFLDGGHVFSAIRETWHTPLVRYEGAVPVQVLPPDRARALTMTALYLALAAALVLGMLATRHSGAL